MAKGLSLAGCEGTVVAVFPHYPHGNVPECAFFGVWMLQTYAVSLQIMTNIAFTSIAIIIIGFFLVSTAITRITKKMNGNN